MKVANYLRLIAVTAMFTLVGCGGSSSSDKVSDSYVQFYHAAPNAANTSLKVGDTLIGNATFADVSSLTAVAADSYTISFDETLGEQQLLTEQARFVAGEKTLFIMTETEQQYDYLSLSFKRDDSLDKAFNVYFVNLSQQPELDIYMSAENETFAEAELIEALSAKAISSMVSKATGKYNLYLTAAGHTTPLFVSKGLNMAYTSSYVIILRDQHGPIANQLVADVILNSSTVASFKHLDANAQFRLYNSLEQAVQLAVDNQPVLSLQPGENSGYQMTHKGDYSLNISTADNQSLLTGGLLSLAAGDSKAVLLYSNANQQAQIMALAEATKPQLQSHDINVVNLVTDIERLQFYFVRQDETIADARYAVKNLAFEKQQSLVLPKDSYDIALVHIAENGSAILLDRLFSQQLMPSKHYMLLAEQDAAAPSGYKLTLVK
ncbi:hypothetical protein BI198_10250 [Rheinheimera salexigens]|uniref:DUF4397 domain-containing protein n=2 Tax=Rheinheimera salexigens TaxID=1628148 RepID=A0A1E7QA22_9GAMM|nr:hypothetical protein BI198_10250 [Rheinheimera salexigens]